MSLDIYLQETQVVDVWEANITHNLARMAKEAGLYQAMWHPEELAIERAFDLVPHLQAGIVQLVSNPDRFIALNPANGWGSYDLLLSVATNYLRACRENPKATIRVSR